MRLLVAGGAGFLGAHFIRYILEHYDPEFVTNVDALLRPEGERALDEATSGCRERYEFFKGDIGNADFVEAVMRRHRYYAVLNFASTAEHDGIATSPRNYIRSNIGGTAVLLDAARRAGVKRFLQISGDLVYGHRAEGECREDAPLRPHTWFAGTKAAADMLAVANAAHGSMEVSILRPVNVFGPWQPVEKLVARAVVGALGVGRIPVLGEGAEMREWLYVDDFCSAVVAVLFAARPPEVVNVSAGERRSVLEVVRAVLERLGRGDEAMVFVSHDESQDARRAVDASLLRTGLGWAPLVSFDAALDRTVAWFRDHPEWWKPAS